MVVGVGVGGSVAVEGNVLPVAGGTAGIIVGNGSGQDKIESINTATTSTTSKTSSSSSSPTASPTPYNIYPRFDSTSRQQSAFARDLERIAQPGSVRSVIGVRDKLLLWVASLTPAQASELSRNPVVSPTWCYMLRSYTLSLGPGPQCGSTNTAHSEKGESKWHVLTVELSSRDLLTSKA